MKISKRLQLPGMMFVTLLTQFLGLYKTLVLGNIFGASVELDAYNFCNSITNFFLVFISAGVTTVVLPAYIKKQKREHIDAFASMLFVIVGTLLALLFIFRTYIIDALTTREGDFLTYTRWMLIFSIVTQTLPALLSVTTAYYQAHNRFIIPKAILLLSNMVVVGGLIFIKSISLKQYVQILLIAAIIQFILDVGIAILCGFRFKFNLRIRNAETKQLFIIFLPTVVSAGVFQIHSLIDTLVTSGLADGLLTIQSYANLIVSTINGFVVANLVTYIYPNLVHKMQESKSETQALLWKYSRVFHCCICAIVVMFCTVGHECLIILFGNGKFTEENIRMLFICATIYLFGQQIGVIRDLIYRFLYADSDTITPLKNSIVISVLNIILSLALVRFLGLFGVALGNVISSMASLTFVVLKIRKKYGFVPSIRDTTISIIKTLVTSVITVVLVFLMKYCLPTFGPWVSLLIYVPVTMVLYMGVNLALKNRGMLDIFGKIFKK